jgi:hypothetical protein
MSERSAASITSMWQEPQASRDHAIVGRVVKRTNSGASRFSKV